MLIVALQLASTEMLEDLHCGAHPWALSCLVIKIGMKKALTPKQD
jgi:hypothetical protein